MNVACVDRVCSEVNEKRNDVEHERERERKRKGESSMRASAKTKREVKDRQYPFLRRKQKRISPGFLAGF